ncbi:hypothetical protein UlMin_007850 [Ulmus minor]
MIPLLHPLFLLSLFLLALLFLFIRTRSSGKNNLKLPPSPTRLPIIGNLYQLGTHPHRSLKSLSEKFGPLMLLSFGQVPTLVVSSADIVNDIIKNHDVVFSSRPKTTAGDILLYGGKNVSFAPYGEYWRQVRKICVVELLSLRRVQEFGYVRDEEVVVLVDKLHEACLDESCVNLSAMLMATFNNIICRCVLGQSYSEENDGGSKYGELSRRMMVDMMAFCFGDFFPSLKWIDVLIGFTARVRSTAQALDAFSDQVVEEHKTKKSYSGGSTNLEDFVDILLRVQKEGTLDFELTGENIKAILQDMLVGGTDTTTTTIEWLMAELIRNPRVMKKTQDEVRRVVGKKPEIDMNDINQMAYLKCVIKESMRLHPTAPFLLPRETTSSIEMKGYNIPAKTRVLINVFAIHRDSNSWERPEEFFPERFENNPIDFKGQDSHLIPFGFGRRGCPGLMFGMINLEYIIANILYWFDWKLSNNEASPEDLDMSEIYGVVLHKKVPLHLIPVSYLP